MFRFAVAFALAALPAFAGPFDRVQPVFDALDMSELIEIMHEEGVGYGESIESQMFAGRGGQPWRGYVDRLYAPATMEAAVLAGLDAELRDEDIAGITEFFGSELGRRIVSLEVSARRAMLDETVQDTASEGWQEIAAANARRWQLLRDFAEANDLVESNVAAAMTAELAFYQGLVDGGAFNFVLTEDDMLSEIWAKEPQIRDDTSGWVYSFTSLAYAPLSDAELEQYLDYTRTPSGKAMNAALFAAFNDVFAGISHQLGLGAAPYLAGQDL